MIEIVKNIPMLHHPNRKAVLFFAGLFAVEMTWQIYKKFRVKTRSKIITEVIFFSEESSLCRMHAVSKTLCSNSNCSVKNIRKMCAYLESARRTLDICVYLFSAADFAAAIGRAFNRGVVIRIIVDASMAENSACDKLIRILQDKGIKIRMKKSEYLMHHKFALIDGSLLMTGSTNWTMQAMFGNWENVIVSNQPALVKPFVKEFDNMWKILTKDED